MKAIILCGGRGTRFHESTEARPKPLIEVGDRPILWHIMKLYAHHGITEFILCLGYKGWLIKDYFLNYEPMNSDFTVDLGRGRDLTYHGRTHAEDGWKVTLADTGENSMTGARVKMASKYLDGGTFCVTYGDGVSDVDLRAGLKFHQRHGKLATLTGVRSPSRFGELRHEAGHVQAFSEKPEIAGALISGGFFFFEPPVLEYLSEDAGCILEKDLLERVAADGQLCVYEHAGFWQCMDTYRDWEKLDRQWQTGQAPWKVWP